MIIHREATMRAVAFSSSPSSSLSINVRRALFFHHSVAEERHQQQTERKTIEECGRNDGRDVKVSVWWDFENCSVPAGVSVCRVAHRITSALRASGIRGPVDITAFGDTSQLSRSVQETLSATGVSLCHVPRRGKNSADKNLLVDLVYWVSQNPPPAHLFLISGDGDFSNVLHRLRMSNYNILLACKEPISPMLYGAATIMWPWSSLVKGHTFVGKHFNHPPDGKSSSWYGYFKGPLEDPFVDVSQPQIDHLQTEGSHELAMEMNIRPVPKLTVERIHRIVNSCPHGIGIGIDKLRAELIRKNMVKPKDYFGHAKFSHFILSLPCLRIKSDPYKEGKLVVYYRCPKPAEPVNLNSTSSSESTSSSFSPEQLKGGTVPLVSEGEIKALVQDTFPSVGVVREAKEPMEMDLSGDGPTAINEQKSKESLLERLQGFFFGTKIHASGVKSALGTNDSSSRNSGEQPRCYPSASTNLTSGSIESDSMGKGFQTSFDGLRPVSKLVKLIFGSGSFWAFNKTDSSSVSDKTMKIEGAESCEGINMQCKNDSSAHDFASRPNFWDDVKSFLCSAEGASLVSKAKSRRDIVKELQKDGPSILGTLSDGSLNHLVDTLISDKKWIKESVCCPFPFKVLLTKNNSSSSSTNRASKGLSSIFSTGVLSSEATSTEACEYLKIMENGRSIMKPKDLEELSAWLQSIHDNHESIHLAGLKRHFEGQFHSRFDPSVYGFDTAEELLEACYAYATNGNTGKTSVPSREKIIGDCQVMLDELLNQYPQGFNLGMLKVSFHQKYGYNLDHQTLGYPKLSSLIQIMRGVGVDGACVFPMQEIINKCNHQDEAAGLSIIHQYEAINLDSGGSDSGGSDDEVGQESTFEEHGPVTEIDDPAVLCENSDQEVKNLSLSVESSSLSEDLTDSECVSSTENDERKPETCAGSVKQDSLMQILDRWYEIQDHGKKKQQQGLDGLVDYSHVSDPTSDVRNYYGAVNQCQKLKHRKNYSFVRGAASDEKEKLIHGILRTLKRSPDSNSEGQDQHAS